MEGGEIELQQLLATSTSLVPIRDIREGGSPLLVSVTEIGLPGSGSTEAVMFTSTGDIRPCPAAVPRCKRSSGGRSCALELISSVLFGVAHIGYGYGALLPVASGWVLGWARQQTGGLKAPIALHMGLNGTVTALVLTTGSIRLFLIAGILLAVLIGGRSLVDDAAYRDRVEELQRSRRTG